MFSIRSKSLRCFLVFQLFLWKGTAVDDTYFSSSTGVYTTPHAGDIFESNCVTMLIDDEQSRQVNSANNSKMQEFIIVAPLFVASRAGSAISQS